jgi:hypothetical protein
MGSISQTSPPKRRGFTEWIIRSPGKIIRVQLTARLRPVGDGDYAPEGRAYGSERKMEYWDFESDPCFFEDGDEIN